MKALGLFDDANQLKIPYFQRSYVWDEEQWKRFFEDIVNVSQIGTVYFLGAVILKNEGRDNARREVLTIIDGQQRLTTIVIFMKALALLSGNNDDFKKRFLHEDTGEAVLLPNKADSAAFCNILNIETIAGCKQNSQTQVEKALGYFIEKIKNEGAFPTDLRNALERLVQFVIITVNTDEPEQQIFDTINSLGVKLTTGELLKNYLFSSENANVYEQCWAPVFEKGHMHDYWTDDLTKGRLKDNNIEHFFYCYMLIKMQDPGLKEALTIEEKKSYRKEDGLFDSFKLLMKNHRDLINKDDLIKDIIDYAKVYHENFDKKVLDSAIPTVSCIKRLSCIMYVLGSWTMMPYLLYILKNVKDSDERNKIFGFLESYIVRRMVCKSKNNNYSDLFSENLIGQHVQRFNELNVYFDNKEDDSALAKPSDNRVFEALENCEMKNKKNNFLIMYLLESKMNSHFNEENIRESNGFNNLEVAQLLSANADIDNWPYALGYDENSRKDVVASLGNFCLFREKVTSTESKAAWLRKKELLKGKVDDLFTSSIITRNLDVWDEKSIMDRNKILATKIISYWK